MNILLVGVGLIGGSFALSLKKDEQLKFGGYDIDAKNLEEAKKLGIITELFNDQEEAINWADTILLAIPVNAIKGWLKGNLSKLRKDQLVVDFGSTKGAICESVEDHPNRSQYLSAHPIAGTEHSGASAAFASLYEGMNLIICDEEKTDPTLSSAFEKLAVAAGFYLTKMDSKEHDRHLAYISHLSHITSYVLSNTVLNKEKDGEIILELAGSGFASTVRLAKSSPAMWSAIFTENKDMVLNGIQAYREELEKLESMISANSKDEISAYLEEGRKIRKILK